MESQSPETTGPSRGWWTVKEAASYVSCKSPRPLYRAVAEGQLRAARIGHRRNIRFKMEWLDEWMEASARPVELRR